jgi:hypothetical protein
LQGTCKPLTHTQTLTHPPIHTHTHTHVVICSLSQQISAQRHQARLCLTSQSLSSGQLNHGTVAAINIRRQDSPQHHHNSAWPERGQGMRPKVRLSTAPAALPQCLGLRFQCHHPLQC